MDELFNDPYPSYSTVLGSGTKRNISYQIVCDIKDKLKELKGYAVNSDEYDEITDEIKQLMNNSDEFSLGILLYRLWTDVKPPFSSYNKNEYMTFDNGLSEQARQEVLNQMELEIYSVAVLLPDKQTASIVKLIMDCLKSGLDITR
jgi:hypothetical protein